MRAYPPYRQAPPSFLQGLGLAVLFALFTPALIKLFGLLGLPPLTASISFIAACYAIYLLLVSPRRQGLLSLSLLWFLAALIFLFLRFNPFELMVAHAFLIASLRGFLFLKRPLDFVFELALNALAVLGALIVFLSSYSFALSVWSFFLCQCAFIWLPSAPFALKRSLNSRVENSTFQSNSLKVDGDVRFHTALRRAELALKQLATH